MYGDTINDDEMCHGGGVADTGLDSSSRPPHFSSADERAAAAELAAAVEATAVAAAAPAPNVLIAAVALRGHATPLLRLGEELVNRGYNVSFATHTRGRDWVNSECRGAHFVSLGKFPLSSNQLRKRLRSASADPSNFHGIRNLFNDIYLPSTADMFASLVPVIQALGPAVIVSDIAALGALDAAASTHTPLVVNNPTLPFSLESPPAWLPAWGTGHSIHMSLWEKCMNLFFPRLLSVALTPPFITLNKHRWSIDLPAFRSQHDIFREARILINTAFGFDHARAMPPLNELVGVIMPPKISAAMQDGDTIIEPPPLPIKKWLRGGSSSNRQFQGVVLVNVGRMAQMQDWQAAELVQGLTDPRFRVLWLVPNDQRRSLLPEQLPPTFRVKSMGSVPHLQILADPSVRAVVSHCGLGSVQEALFFGKPVLCIPYLADQPDIAARVIDAGAGQYLNKLDFTADEINSKVAAIFGEVKPLQGHAGSNGRRRLVPNLDPGNSSFAVNARRVGHFLRLAGGVHRAADVVESTIAAGSAHLRTYSLEQPWHRVRLVDVYAVYFAVVLLAAVFVHSVWLAIVWCARQVMVSGRRLYVLCSPLFLCYCSMHVWLTVCGFRSVLLQAIVSRDAGTLGGKSQADKIKLKDKMETMD